MLVLYCLQDISAIQTDDNTPGNIGATLTLSFDSLKHSDAGLYKCEAINKAATVSKIVSLEVECKFITGQFLCHPL